MGAHLFWVVLIVAVGVFLEFRGPHKGWFERLTGIDWRGEKPPPDAAPATAPGAGDAALDLPPPPGAGDDFFGDIDDGKPAKEPEKTELEKQFDKLYEEALARMRRPQIGKKYKIKLRDRSVVEGKILEVAPGKVVLQVKYGTVTFAMHQIHKSWVDRLFPERGAKRRALKALAKLRAEEEAAKKAAAVPQTPAGTKTVASAAPPWEAAGKTTKPTAPAEPTATQPVAAAAPPPSAGPINYDATPAPSPAHLKGALQAFGKWLEFQHRRVGGKIADKIYAKQQGRNVVLYVVVNPLFLAQEYDIRFQFAEGLHKFWSFRCESMGLVRQLEDAHIVLVDAKRKKIVGGSTAENSAEIWVEKSAGTAVARR